MAEQFDVYGNVIRFAGWVVGRLDLQMPATVRERVIEALHNYETQDIEALEAKAFDEGADSRNAEITELQNQIVDLENEIDVLLSQGVAPGITALPPDEAWPGVTQR